MNLGVKILGALALVIIVALASASWLIDRNTARAYRAYLDQIQSRRLEQLAAQVGPLYAAGEDWTTIQTWLNIIAVGSTPGMGHMGMMPGMRGRNRMPSPDELPTLYLLVDPTSGEPLAGVGSPVTPAQRLTGVPIEIDNRTVALLVPLDVAPRLGQAEQTVLRQVQRAILLSAFVAGLAAVGIGGLVVYTLLRPLTALHQGVTALGRGDLSVVVPVHSNDELGKLAEAFNAMTAQLRRHEELRKQLLADVAHELRTPLSVIQGNLQAMLEGVYPLSADEVRTVHRQTQLLSRLVEDLHELAQAEAGALPLQRQPQSVTAALQQMASLVSPVMARRGITLQVTTPSPDLVISVDPDRLQQILYNLLGNALRHTPAGGTIRLHATQTAAGRARIFVADSGPGIPPEHLPHVFDRFYRVPRDTSTHLKWESGARDESDLTSGAGLGLAIVRALVEAHGGTLGVENTPGSGATFWVELPLAASSLVPSSGSA